MSSSSDGCDGKKATRLKKNNKLSDEQRNDLISSMPEARIEPLTRDANLETEKEQKGFVENTIHLAWFKCHSEAQQDRHEREFYDRISTAMEDPIYRAALKRLELKLEAATEFCKYLDKFQVGSSNFTFSKIL